MLFGASTASLYPQPLETVLEEFGEHGVRTVEVFFNTLCEIEPAFVKKLCRIKREYGIRVVSVHPFTCPFEPFMLFTAYPRRFSDALEWHRHYFEAASELGASLFVFHGDKKAGTLPDEVYFERFAALRDLGKRFGITVAQENVARCKSASLPFLIRMKEALNGDVSFVFDNKQAIRSEVDPFAFVDALGENIAHVHLSDNSKKGDCLPIGEGTADLSALLYALQQKGFQKSVLVELYGEKLPSHEPLYRSIDQLTRIASSIDKKPLKRYHI